QTCALPISQDEGMPIAIGAPNGINADTEPDKGFANILVADDSGIEKLADLENRQIATNSINGQAQLDNTTYMENKGVDVSTIEWIGVPLEQAVETSTPLFSIYVVLSRDR